MDLRGSSFCQFASCHRGVFLEGGPLFPVKKASNHMHVDRHLQTGSSKLQGCVLMEVLKGQACAEPEGRVRRPTCISRAADKDDAMLMHHLHIHHISKHRTQQIPEADSDSPTINRATITNPDSRAHAVQHTLLLKLDSQENIELNAYRQSLRPVCG